MASPQEFAAAPLDRTSRVFTAVTVALLVFMPLGLVLLAPDGQASWVVPLFVLILFFAWAMSPTGYVLDGDRLQVTRRRWRPFTATVTGVADVENPRRVGLRVAGSGGAWGFWGRFWRRDLGIYRAYLTTLDGEHMVALQTEGGLLVLSPDNPRAFAKAVRRRTR